MKGTWDQPDSAALWQHDTRQRQEHTTFSSAIFFLPTASVSGALEPLPSSAFNLGEGRVSLSFREFQGEA